MTPTTTDVVDGRVRLVPGMRATALDCEVKGVVIAVTPRYCVMRADGGDESEAGQEFAQEWNLVAALPAPPPPLIDDERAHAELAEPTDEGPPTVPGFGNYWIELATMLAKAANEIRFRAGEESGTDSKTLSEVSDGLEKHVTTLMRFARDEIVMFNPPERRVIGNAA